VSPFLASQDTVDLPVVYFLVDSALRTEFAAAYRRARDWGTEQVGWPASRDPIDDRDVLFCESIHELLRCFEFRRVHAQVVLDVRIAGQQFRGARSRSPFSTLPGLISLWDSAILAVDTSALKRALSICRVDIPTEVSFVHRECCNCDHMALVFVATWLQLLRLNVSLTGLPPTLCRVEQRVPGTGRTLLARIARDPDWWTVKRLSAVLGISRRSLERRFQRWGLPTPSIVLSELKNARTIAHHNHAVPTLSTDLDSRLK
jgi:AraC-like DNA-binding protein